MELATQGPGLVGSEEAVNLTQSSLPRYHAD